MPEKIKVLLDTNVLISGIISIKGKASSLIDRWTNGEFDLIINFFLIDEFKATIKEDRIQKKYKLTDEKINEFLGKVYELAEITEGKYKIDIKKLKDKEDNPVLACALEGKVDYIITGDNQLLNLKELLWTQTGIQIITLDKFWEILDNK